jgi:hypothetical protein
MIIHVFRDLKHSRTRGLSKSMLFTTLSTTTKRRGDIDPCILNPRGFGFAEISRDDHRTGGLCWPHKVRPRWQSVIGPRILTSLLSVTGHGGFIRISRVHGGWIRFCIYVTGSGVNGRTEQHSTTRPTAGKHTVALFINSGCRATAPRVAIQDMPQHANCWQCRTYIHAI